ncbi:cell adhesion molecule CEACAM19 [Tenrec ecaudatus]|uniref:cell adhesion molecule CEACAM19 n=1 Tax=Tenrec ecaudatus TaxID=94439 RepID=UPI003F5909E7
MELPRGAQAYFSKGLLLSASILWTLQSSQADLYIQKVPEKPLQNQHLLLSVQGIPDAFQDFNWYYGEQIDGSTMLFSYFPGLQRPQRNGDAKGQRDIVGFANGSMLLRRAQPSDSGTYQVLVTIKPSWTMHANTSVQVVEKLQELPRTHLSMNIGMVTAIIIGSLAMGALLMGSLAYLLMKRRWENQTLRVSPPGGQGSLSILVPAVSPVPTTASSEWMTPTEKPELSLNGNTEDNIYEVMPSPVLLVSPFSDQGLRNAAMDLLHPDPAPYCQLVPAP